MPSPDWAGQSFRLGLAAPVDGLPLCRRGCTQRRLRPGTRPNRAARAANSERTRFHGGRRRPRHRPPGRRNPGGDPCHGRRRHRRWSDCGLRPALRRLGETAGTARASEHGLVSSAQPVAWDCGGPCDADRRLAAGAAAARLHCCGDGGQPWRSPWGPSRGDGVRSDILEPGAGRPGGAGPGPRRGISSRRGGRDVHARVGVACAAGILGRVPGPHTGPIRHAIRTGVLSLVLLDAVIGASYGGALYSLVILATGLAAGQLARFFAVT